MSQVNEESASYWKTARERGESEITRWSRTKDEE